MGKKKEGKDKTEIAEVEFENTIPAGEKKDTSNVLNPEYHHEIAESAWYDWWNQKGYFTANNESSKEKFVIMLPPPNVTGSLHLGHALTVSVQDTLVRWNRMKGKECLYLPGIDHAGIATQVVVEKKLKAEENKSRHDLGREKFIEKVWEWKKIYGNRICNQLKRTGGSLDWTREVFTMDETRCKAVTEAFCQLNEKGYIYRANRLVNWCCALNTAISNIEVDYEDFEQKRIPVVGHDDKKKYDFGFIWSFAYPIDGTDEKIIVSTTRPETMLGDTAVAVHPEDPRYKKYHGKFVVHPFNGRKIPIICDAVLVDPNFGTGAVKITPAHDPNDFECGKRHNLQYIDILNDDGSINENGRPFTGMMRFDARDAVVKGLEEKGLFIGKEKHKLSIGRCSRSKDIIEPRVKPQWFVDCGQFAKMGVDAVKNGEMNIHPQSEEKTWFRWLENIQDWCVSRQLWWGHRIPAYLGVINGKVIGDPNDSTSWYVARSAEDAKQQIHAKLSKLPQFANLKIEDISLKQDDDVLDTWFSSGLFPFATLGWPEQTKDLAAFYPGSLLETGTDILFFWVARMVIMGFALMGKAPFKDVFLHAMVRDKFGQKMSKSSGNVIDPIDCIEGCSLEELHQQLLKGNLPEKEIERAKKVQELQFPNGIPKCGTDALRFTLLNYCQQGRDINLDIMRVFGYRTFCNKIWNATRFALTNLSGFAPSKVGAMDFEHGKLSFVDKWILSKLHGCVKASNQCLTDYDFSGFTNALYQFFMNDFCDVYLELLKPLFSSTEESRAAEKRQSQQVLYTVMETYFRLAHPVMPFITEELWQHLPGHSADKLDASNESIMINPYPQAISEWESSIIEKNMESMLDIVHHIRSCKQSYNLTNKQLPEVFVKCDPETAELIKKEQERIESLSCSGKITLVDASDKSQIPKGCAIEVINDKCEAHLLLAGFVDFQSEVVKLGKKKEKLEQVRDGLMKKTSIPDYEKKVPENVRQQNSEKLTQYNGELEQLNSAIEKMQQLL